MKRLYTMVTKAATPGGGYGIHLDGKPVRTPGGQVLTAGNAALADALVLEWAAQKDSVNPHTMPVNQIVITMIDRVKQDRAAMQAAVLKYLDTDLVCYRAPEPEALARAQAAAWDPPLRWFAGRFGCDLQMTTALKALRQADTAHEAAQSAVAALDDERFTALQIICALSGSLVLALAFIEGQCDRHSVFKAMRVEEDYKAAIYKEDIHGPDPAAAARHEAALRDLEAVEEYLRFLS